MKKLDKALRIARDLFPEKPDLKYRTYHFAFLFKRNKVISIGTNQYEPSPKTKRLGERFGIEKYKKYSCPHAETDAISKVWGRVHLDNTYSMVIIRLNRFGKMQNSRPCSACQEILDALDIQDVWWSTQDGITKC